MSWSPHTITDDRSTQQSHGLTLIELMVTICIVSILVGVATVSFKPLWSKHQLSLAVKETSDFIQTLRMKAIVKNNTHQMRSIDNDLYVREKKLHGWSNWAKKELSHSVRILMTGNASFYSKGFASPKTITLAVNSSRQKIVININGRTRISEIY